MTKAQQQFKQWLSNQDNEGLNNIILPIEQTEQLTEIKFILTPLDEITRPFLKELNEIIQVN